MGVSGRMHMCKWYSTSIAPLFIFKGDGISNSLITNQIPSNWCISTSSKGWTSNIHGLEWLRSCFEPETREKAAGRPRLLLCDEYDSHISGNFIAHCMDYNIILLVLPPHTSHILQPLDLSVFGPLKTYLAQETDRYTRTGIQRLQKYEWLEAYRQARPKALSTSNILSGFRRGELIPFSPRPVLRQLPSVEHSSTPTHLETGMEKLLTSTLVNSLALQEANSLFKKAITTGMITSPVKTYVNKLTYLSERLEAELVLTKKESENHRQC